MEKKSRKSLSFSFPSKLGSRKWKSNNLQLARENARLKKDVQKWVQLHTEESLRYNVLEMSWRRRGRTLSKVGLLSRVVGNHIGKAMDYVTEIQAACQEELSMPHDEVTDNSECFSRCRHSMPNINLGRLSRTREVSQLCTRSQLIHQVKPMVSGHLIIKPTIALQRLNLQDVQTFSPVERMQSPLPESIEADQVEEVDLTAESATVSSLASSDEEKSVQVPRIQSTRKTYDCSSSVTSPDAMLPVAVVPLERVSLPKKAAEKNTCDQLVMENDSTVLLNKDPSATSEHSSMLSFSEHSKEVSEICSNIPSGTSSPDNNICSISKDTAAVIENKSVLTDRRSSNCSVKKYPGSSRTKTSASSELWNSQTKCVNEKCQLVVTLEDIRDFFPNGAWISAKKVEEGKLKDHAVTHPESKEKSSEGGNEDLEISMLNTSIENQTHLNFTAGIGTLDYIAVPSDNGDMEVRVLTPKEEFLKRIRSEDPLEGASWHYQNDATATGRKRQSRTFCAQKSPTKAKSGNQWAVPYITCKTQSSDRSMHQPTSNHNGDPLAETTTQSDVDMDITQCIPLTIVTNNISTSEVVKEENSYLVHNSVLCKKQPEASDICSTEEVIVLKHKKKPRTKYNGDSSDESVLDEEWKPSKNRRKNSKQQKARPAKMRCKSLPRRMKTGSTAVAEQSQIEREPSVEHIEMLNVSQGRNTSPQLVCMNTDIKKENVNNLPVRTKRRAAPTSLKEASLVVKMRRDTS